MSGAEPCTGSNRDGNSRSGLLLADGAMPMVPVHAGPCADRMSMWYWLVFTSGYCAAINLKRSSQYGMVIEMPFDLVAEVTCFFRLLRASSNAKRMMRATPRGRDGAVWTPGSG